MIMSPHKNTFVVLPAGNPTLEIQRLATMKPIIHFASDHGTSGDSFVTLHAY